jgi:hypothetical protein
MAGPTTIRNRADGLTLTPSASAPSEDAAVSLEQGIGEAIAFVLRGDWAQAEHTIHAFLQGVPREALAQTYIACLDLVARHLAAMPPTLGPRALVTGPPARPRLLARPDPALDYAYAVLTALRGRLTTGTSAVRQAS